MKKVVLIGADGQLGKDLVKVFKTKKKKFKLFPLTIGDLDLKHFHTQKYKIDKIKPDIIISTAAFHDVDKVEADPWMGFAINAEATKDLAEYCKKKKVKLVWISTDYVFGGEGGLKKIPYDELHRPFPINAYGISKLAGELFIQYIGPDHLIIRTSALFGEAGPVGKGMNFVELMLSLAKKKKELRVANDQILSFTYSLDLAKQIVYLLEKNQYCLFHITSQGYCSRYQFTKHLFTLMKIKTKLIPCSLDEFPTRAERPKFSPLCSIRLRSLNKMETWKTGLLYYLIEKKYIKWH